MDKILPLVQKPSRYINNEWNSSYRELTGTAVRVCFCFPDLYELGASNLGIEILYHLVNSLPGASAERCYCPDVDLEQILRRENIPMFSTESQKPLKEFDILGFSLQYELCFTNVLTMLNLAGIPLKSSERDGINCDYPIILGGGPVSFNPEPVAEFFDAFVVGEGEDAVCEIIECMKNSRENKKNRKEILKALSEIEGVYVPAIPRQVNKRTVDLKKSFFPVNQIVPNVITVHSRLNIEISRGCAHRCRFCQASGLYSPWRERDPREIMSMIEKGIPATGFDQISLLSLSVTDYSGIEGLVHSVNNYALKNNVSLSLPSLRCSRISTNLLKNLIYPRRSNITLAVETASPALRAVIDKQINDEELFEFVREARNLGWNLLKLYFMIGLPGETMEDIYSIITLVNSLKKAVPGMKFNVTVSPFVPKPHTVFQWSRMENVEILESKKNILYKKLKADVKAHNIKMSVLEAVFARGGKELSKVILFAWEKGARFDHWHDKFNYSLWDDAFKSAGIEKDAYLGEREKNAAFPWDFIGSGCGRETLWNGYSRALEAVENREHVELRIPAIVPTPSRQSPVYNVSKENSRPFLVKYRLKFSRAGRMRFLSHLEQIELIRRTLKRAGLPVAYTAGFHPQMKMSFGPAVSVGCESACEFADAVFTRQLEIKDAAKAINSSLPGEFSLIEIRQVPNFSKPVDTEANVVSYSIRDLTASTGILPEEIEKAVASALACADIAVEKKPGKIINARPLLLKMEWNGLLLKLELRSQQGNNIKPEKLIGKILGIGADEIKLLRIKRENLFSEKSPGVLIKI